MLTIHYLIDYFATAAYSQLGIPHSIPRNFEVSKSV